MATYLFEGFTAYSRRGMMFQVVLRSSKKAEVSETKVFFDEDTRIQFGIMSDLSGTLVIRLNGELYHVTEMTPDKEWVYPPQDSTAPLAVFVHVLSDEAVMNFEFIPADDAPAHAERQFCEVTLARTHQGAGCPVCESLLTLCELQGSSRSTQWRVTRMGAVIVEGVRSRTIRFSRNLSEISPEALKRQRAVQEARVGVPVMTGRHDLNM